MNIGRNVERQTAYLDDNITNLFSFLCKYIKKICNLKENFELEKLLRKLFIRYPNNQDIQCCLAVSIEKLKSEEAFQLYEKVLEINPNHIYANLYLADYYRSCRNNDEAKKYYKKIKDMKELGYI